MKEIISLSVGTCGHNVGGDFWQEIASEHDINISDGLIDGNLSGDTGKPEVNFHQESNGKFISRSIIVDTKFIPQSIVPLELIRPENIISREIGCPNIWACGFVSNGPEIIEQILESIRKENELCDSLQGFQMFHSLGGGTGSGLGSLILDSLKDQYTSKIISTFSIFPSKLICDNVVSDYSVALTLPHLIYSIDTCFLFDNEALFHRVEGQGTNSSKLIFGDMMAMNKIITSAVVDITSPLRHYNTINDTMETMTTNLTNNHNKLKFLSTSVLPWQFGQHNKYNKNRPTFQEISLLLPLFNTTTCTPQYNLFLFDTHVNNVYLNQRMCIFRGVLSRPEFRSEINEFYSQNNKNTMYEFANFAPHKKNDFSVTMVGNQTGIVEIFENLSKRYHTLYSRKAFGKWYTGEGLDETWFTEAQECLTDLIETYKSVEHK